MFTKKCPQSVPGAGTAVCTEYTMAVDSTVFIKRMWDPNAVAKGLFLQFFPCLCESVLLVFYGSHMSQGACHKYLVDGRTAN